MNKKTKKFVSLMLVVLMSCISVVGCGNKVEDSKPIIIKASATQAPSEPPIVAMTKFKEIVEEKSEGKIKVEIYPDNQLGNERDVIEGVQLGTIEMTWSSSAVLSSFVPELNIFELPFLFESREQMHRVLDSDIGMEYGKNFEKKGFKLFGYFDLGERHIMTNVKAINSMEDLKGLKIRTMENPAHLDAFKAFGANPLPMAYGELYTALESKVIDGAEAANTNYFAKKFYEPAPNWAIVGWVRLVSPVFMSDKFYKSLSDEHKKIIDEAVLEAIKEERELYAQSEIDALEDLKKNGVNVTYPDVQAFMKASEKVYDAWADKVGGREKIDAIVNFK